MRVLVGAAIAVMVLSSVAGAENRYTLAETDSGTVRLDRKTGTVSFCRKVGVSLACSMAAEERAAMEKAQREFTARIDVLEERLANLELAVLEAEQERESSNLEKPKTLPQADDRQLRGKEERQIDKALRVTETVMRRFIGMMKDFKRDFQSD